VVIRFAGDSGDGMQLTGDRFSVSSALFGNDLSTVPDYPADTSPEGNAGRGLGLPDPHLGPRHPDARRFASGTTWQTSWCVADLRGPGYRAAGSVT